MRPDVSLSNVWQVILSFGGAVWAGVFTAIIVFVIEVILSTKKIILVGREKKLKEQKRRGMLFQVLEQSVPIVHHFLMQKQLVEYMMQHTNIT